MPQKKVVVRPRSVGAKLTEEQYTLVRERAAQMGISPGEFLRFVTLERLYSPIETRLMLAEMIRLQKIILSFHATVLNGGTLTRERIDSIVREADQGKFELADQRIAAGLNAPSTLEVLKAFGGHNG